MANIPPKMVVKLLAILGGIILFFIILGWISFLILQRLGFIYDDKPDTGGSKWNVQIIEQEPEFCARYRQGFEV